MLRPRPCKFFSKLGGCRRGSDCSFAHESSSESHEECTAPKVVASAPPGRCRFFWASGQCRFGFNCKYIHEQGSTEEKADSHQGRERAAASGTISQSGVLGNPTPTIHQQRPIQGNTRLIWRERATVAGLQNNILENLTPIQVHNQLRRFLESDFRFGLLSPSPNRDICTFIALLGNATKENDWTVEDGQMLLTNIAQPGKSGLLRLGDIIRYSQVSVNAAASSSRVSFQKAYLGLTMYFSSDFVVKSAISRDVNSLYSLIHNDVAMFAATVTDCMNKLISNRDFKDVNTSVHPAYLTGNRIFFALSTMIFEYVTRFRNSIVQSPDVISLIRKLNEWVFAWSEGINSDPPTFKDDWASKVSSESRAFTVRSIKEKVRDLVTIINRTEVSTIRPSIARPLSSVKDAANIAALAYLEANFEGPGRFREGPPRHDNDHEDIADIRIAPTHEELICTKPPYLPVTVVGAPHHLPVGTMERWLDTQFRLLREELIAPLRTALQCVLRDMTVYKNKKTMLATLIDNRGGRYVGGTGGNNKLMFNLYTNCKATKIDFNPYKDVIVDMSLDAPPGSARSSQASSRRKFWEGRGGKRFMSGSLVGLVRGEGSSAKAYLGVVSSSGEELVSSSQQAQDQIQIQITFFDSDMLLQTLGDLRQGGNNKIISQLLIESPVMFETIRPFLEALRREPTMIPFSKYLVPASSLSDIAIDPPKYSISPGFTYDLRCLFTKDPPEPVFLRVDDEASVAACRESLRSDISRLDPSQANALLDSLSREVSLIQGPPGTGKTYVGVELLRVLKANDVGPILMIAYTNHALDHMLSSVLDSEITKRIVRLGSRSADERISKFNFDTLEQVQRENSQDRYLKSEFWLLKETQERLNDLVSKIMLQEVDAKSLEKYLYTSYPRHFESLWEPPIWIELLCSATPNSEWQTVGSKSETDNSVYFGFWEGGNDLSFLRARQNVHEKTQHQSPPDFSKNRFSALEEKERVKDEDDHTVYDEDIDLDYKMNLGPAASWLQNWDLKDDTPSQEALPKEEDLKQPQPAMKDEDHPEDEIFGDGNSIPEIPQTDRSLDDLLNSNIHMWSLSISERRKLSQHWRVVSRETVTEEERGEFDRLRKTYREHRTHYNEIKDQIKLQLLKNIDLVGCTTTGAAKFSALLKSFSPKVLVVEEAGQVLEAHVLGSLVPSVEHLILIGDPLQLRPNLANYNLSIDSKGGSMLYRFDVSLMERLSRSGLSMSQLEVQRRMRPSISNLIKQTLYPSLQDHPLTNEYPAVRGMSKNVFFMSHEHREIGGGEDSMSKHNAFEVQMAAALVLYLLRQGCYAEDGDIVVLCAYLGQLVRMRDALAGKVVTLIDDRDQALIATHDDGEEREDSIAVERVAVNRKVLLRTVDNFQGEEAKIIILSLVRNSGSGQDDELKAAFSRTFQPSIGFLKSENRTNVALSRAQHGLYIMGNTGELRDKSPMWATVIDTLDSEDCVGNGFPIQCFKHPQEINLVTEPEMLSHFAPDGGCLQPCAEPLRCGHVCPYKCHPDDESHISISCLQRCLRQCPKGHPCNKPCRERCGLCMHPIANTSLSCGHVVSVPCHMIDNLSKFRCREFVEKHFLRCEHTKPVECSEDIEIYKCTSPCNSLLPCCGRKCQFKCGECQDVNQQTTNCVTPRISHCEHPCRRTLFCGHPCMVPCSENHECTQRCEMRCQRRCDHASCTKQCHVVCAPCAEPCTWSCPHKGTCPLPCGSICSRLPCDERCTKILKCGHRCPSLCGEPCAICITCVSDERKAEVVDLIMGITLGEIEPADALASLVLTLSCGHTFTVETLDGHCDIASLYSQTADGHWSNVCDQSIEPGFKKTPTCPNCRAPITIPRYGRAFKRSALDMAELNVASDMSRSISSLQSRFSTFGAEITANDEEKMKKILKLRTKFNSENAKKLIMQAQRKQLNKSNKGKIAARFFSLGNKNIFMVPEGIAGIWRTKTSGLIKCYEDCIETAQQRPAHVAAYQNGLSKLYWLELETFVRSDKGGPQNPEENAMRIARLKVGRPPPRADKRFCVEALWLSVKIRFKLAEFAEKMLNFIIRFGSQSDQFTWASFNRFIYTSCIQDVEFASEIAQKSESYRQVVSSNLLKIRAKFEEFRFDVEMWKRQSQSHSRAEREKLAKATAEARNEARKTIQTTSHDFSSRTQQKDDCEWLRRNFIDQGKKILEHWEGLEDSLLRDTFYEPVSRDELTQIVRAFEFTHSGHWYTCENGHMYAIGECGGAMQQAVCPECRAPIGGTGHNLDTSNRRATELEEITREEGADRSPWPWAL